MTCLAVRYKKEFTQDFKDALKKLDLKQSDVFSNATQAVIDQANKQE